MTRRVTCPKSPRGFNNSCKIRIAARWCLDHGDSWWRGVIPTLREKFSLANTEAEEALTAARSITREGIPTV